MFAAEDIQQPHKDVPCTNTIQFLVRDGKLDMYTSMRSNDAYIGLPHDIFTFTLIQEIIARSLDLRVGIYKHYVSSLHLYNRSLKKVKKYLNEGFQATNVCMPEMPKEDPWYSIGIMLKSEQSLRLYGTIDEESLESLDPYWLDLVLLLKIWSFKKSKNNSGLWNK